MVTRTLPPPQEMLEAFRSRDSRYEGLFFAAVRSTSIFCRPTCPARKADPSNLEFFATAAEAMAAGYRPCRRCLPLQDPAALPGWVLKLLNLIESDPSARWTDTDIRNAGIHPERVRRWFRTHYGMTFQAYIRSRRLGLALDRIRKGEDQLEVAFEHGYDSLSGFRSAFQEVVGLPPGKSRQVTQVTVNRLSTPLGPMLAGALDQGLCLLEFTDRKTLQQQLERLRRLLGCVLIPGSHPVLDAAAAQLDAYFKGKLTCFDVPLVTPGTPFERSVWQELQQIPYGETVNYAGQARQIGRPQAFRAVARANGANRIAIIIPCHRVIGSDGKLCGYAAGLWRKQYLLDLERSVGIGASGQTPEPSPRP